LSMAAAGLEQDQRRLNGPQTTGRSYRNLSEAWYEMAHDENVGVAMRDGARLLAAPPPRSARAGSRPACAKSTSPPAARAHPCWPAGGPSPCPSTSPSPTACPPSPTRADSAPGTHPPTAVQRRPAQADPGHHGLSPRARRHQQPQHNSHQLAATGAGDIVGLAVTGAAGSSTVAQRPPAARGMRVRIPSSVREPRDPHSRFGFFVS
jgi:hypothetical protein